MIRLDLGHGLRIVEQVVMQRKGDELFRLFELLRRLGALYRLGIFALLRPLSRLGTLRLSDDGLRALGGRRDRRRLGGDGARIVGSAQLLDIDQDIRKSALDSFQQTKTRVRGIETPHQAGDAVLQVA
jgi:hypothetical protein